MLSAGNDIVSLSEINVARTKIEALYSKILSAAELTLYESIKNDILFEHYVWLLWSVKESAFKFLQRIKPDLLFTPVKFEITRLEIPGNYPIVNFGSSKEPARITGDVQFDNYKVYLRSVIYLEFISSVVNNDKDFQGVFSDIKYFDSTMKTVQSAEVRAFVINRLKTETGFSDLIIKKNPQDIPVLYNGSNEMRIPVSLSHHGHYIGYSFKLK